MVRLWSGSVNGDVGVILGFTVAPRAGGALTLRRCTGHVPAGQSVTGLPGNRAERS
jgi:hypothetical protein